MNLLHRLLKDESGGPAIEFTMVALFAAICLPALLDVMTLMHANTQLASGMRAGTQYALKYPTDNEGITESIKQASGMNEVTVSNEQFCECAGTANSCSSTCGAGITRAKYNTINVTYSMGNRYNYESLYPSLLTKTLTVRVQ